APASTLWGRRPIWLVLGRSIANLAPPKIPQHRGSILGPSLDASIALVAIAPFIAAILAPTIQRVLGSYAGWVLAAIPASIFRFLLGLLPGVAGGVPVTASIDWIPAHGIALSFMLDGLALLF